MAEYCYCGRLVVVRTTWTNSNAGKRFVNCVQGRVGCNYFRWIEDPVCDHGRTMICGLLGRVRALEADLERILNGVCNEQVQVKKHGSPRCLIWLYVVIALCIGLFFSIASTNKCNDNDCVGKM